MVNVSHNGEPWRGVHLLLHTNAEMDALMAELPHLAELGINVLLAEVDYWYAYRSHPELAALNAITPDRAHALAQVCRANGVRLIPQFQCLGHQSWAEETHPLLLRYPQFDETPGQFPNNEGIYCRSWCPQHPEVNPIIFALFDDLLDDFEADALHVGMDEVFLIASEHCPRCRGHEPAALYAQAVNDYYAHLVGKRGVEMLMWADRFINDAETGYGEWEADRLNLYPALECVPRDIILCDWHYTVRSDYPSIPLFLEKGFRVWPAGWREVEATESLIAYALQQAQPGMMGYLCTLWGAAQPGQLTQFAPLLKASEMLR